MKDFLPLFNGTDKKMFESDEILLFKLFLLNYYKCNKNQKIGTCN